MKKVILFIIAAVAIAGCGPELYTGPLESPVGSWEGVRTEYFFNGEKTADLDTAEYTAISFYKQGLCCIEGKKGSFPYTYDHEARELIIDNSYWAVHLLTGTELVMEYIETIFQVEDEAIEKVTKTNSSDDTGIPEEDDVSEMKPDRNGVIIPAEFNGITIYSDDNGYYYETNDYNKTYCNFYGQKDETGTLIIEFWYDNHIDHFIPLVVETEK